MNPPNGCETFNVGEGGLPQGPNDDGGRSYIPPSLVQATILVQWDELGLEEMLSEEERSGSGLQGAARAQHSVQRQVTVGLQAWLTGSSESEASEFSTDVTDTRRVQTRVMQRSGPVMAAPA